MLQEFTRKLIAGQHLAEAEAEQALELILSESTSDAVIVSFLTALALKEETPEEITGFARVMRRRAVSIRSHHAKLIDTAGTGGGAETFNISTTAAFVIAGAGLPVAKHGNRAVTSRCGSADVLAALGVQIDRPPEVAERALNEVGIAFMFAPLFHPAMKRVAQIRRELGRRTIFNLLGPLTNPAGASYQIIGVYARDLTDKVARALAGLGCRRAWVLHSDDGLDELSPAGARVSEVEGTSVKTFDFAPFASLRFSNRPDAKDAKIEAGTPEENAQLTRGILEGKVRRYPREIVLLNAAAALHVAGEGEFDQAFQKAEESLNSGAALTKLEQLIEAYSR